MTGVQTCALPICFPVTILRGTILDAQGNVDEITDTEDMTDTEENTLTTQKPVDAGRPQGVKRDNEGNPKTMEPTLQAASTTTLALRSAAPGSSSLGTGETPLSNHDSPELGVLTETRTVFLPFEFGVSFNKIGKTIGGNVLKIRMNAPYNILKDTVFVAQTESAAAESGVSNCQATAYQTTTGSELYEFQQTFEGLTGQSASSTGSGSLTDTSTNPAWRAWYQELYDAYHTIETQYEIILTNTESSAGSSISNAHSVITSP